MEIMLILKAVLSLIFVLGLLFVTIWALKYFEFKTAKNSFIKKLKKNSRIEISEMKRIDIKNSVVLIKRDNVEHLVLLSAGHNLIIESDIKPTKEPK